MSDGRKRASATSVDDGDSKRARLAHSLSELDDQDRQTVALIAEVTATSPADVLSSSSSSSSMLMSDDKRSGSFETTRVWKTAPLHGQYVPVTDDLGRRRYLLLRDKDADADAGEDLSSTERSAIGSSRPGRVSVPRSEAGAAFLRAIGAETAPIGELLARIEARKRMRRLRELEERATSSEASGGQGASGGQLWVDKYRPHSFSELLSPETVNRRLLQWIKSWEPLVFGDKQRDGDGDEAARRRHHRHHHHHQQQQQQHNGPERKVALLCGPPGLGKTTVAHLLARIAGYRTVEINASDDRSGEGFMVKLLNAVETQTAAALTTQERRPNCLIVDELDGASNDDASAVEAILRVLDYKAAKTAVEKRRRRPGDGRQRLPKPSRPLARPIICICNNQFVPALRELRQRAELFVFERPSAPLLVQRLRHVCQLEGLRVDSHLLSLLADRADGDVRFCLNTLQYLRSRGTSCTLEDLAAACVGHKDAQRSLFDLWTAVFFNGNRRRQAEHEARWRVQQQQEQEEQQDGDDFAREFSRQRFDEQRRFLRDTEEPSLIEQLSATHDYEVLLAGCHENFLEAFYADALFQRTASCLEDGLSGADVMLRLRDVEQAYELNRFVPYCIMRFSLNCATSVKPVVRFPTATAKAQQQRRRLAAVAQTFLHGCPADSSLRDANCADFAASVAPYVAFIISPSFRHGNVRFLEQHDRQLLLELVELFRRYRLRFLSTGDDATVAAASLALDPPILQLSQFDSSPSLTAPQQGWLTYAPLLPLQMLTIHNLLEYNPLGGGGGGGDAKQAKGRAPAVRPPSLEKAKPVPLPQFDTQRDFFGREVAVGPAQSSAAAPEHSVARVVFKFHEGTTNAVRRPVATKVFH